MKLYHLDMKVSMFNADYLMRWFGKLKESGFGGVVIEIDNKLRYPSHPDFAAQDALDADEWRSIVKYGKKLGLAVYPLLQTLGHMEHVLTHSVKYQHLAENPGNNYMLCPSKEGTFKLIGDMMKDLYEVFDRPGRIHLGGDESFRHMELRGLCKCPLCMCEENGRLMNKYLVRLAGLSLELGMLPEFWADEVVAYPELLSRFPKETRFIDWNYVRTDMNGFGRTRLIKENGYEVVVASAVRFSGDSYALPRIEKIIKNVGVSEKASKEFQCDHLVTSWAIRLSHPETTWPGLMAAGPEQVYAPEEVTACLGGIDRGVFFSLCEAGEGLSSVDIPTEAKMRFERPYNDNYFKAVYDLWQGEGRRETQEKLEKRIHACNHALAALEISLSEKRGEPLCLRHWSVGLKLCLLRTEQVKTIFDSYADGLKIKRLKELLERNTILMEEFEELWAESTTEYSLNQEKEIKFLRDIRLLENLIYT